MTSKNNNADDCGAKRKSVVVITIDDDDSPVKIEDNPSSSSTSKNKDNPSSSSTFKNKRDAASRRIVSAKPKKSESLNSAIDVTFEEEAHNKTQASDYVDSSSDISEEEVFRLDDFDVSSQCSLSDTESDDSSATIDLTSDVDTDSDDSSATVDLTSDNEEMESDEYRSDTSCDVRRDLASDFDHRPPIPPFKFFKLIDKNFGDCKICDGTVGKREKYR